MRPIPKYRETFFIAPGLRGLQVMQPHSGQPLQSAKRANRHSAVFNCALTAGPRDSPTSSLAYLGSR